MEERVLQIIKFSNLYILNKEYLLLNNYINYLSLEYIK